MPSPLPLVPSSAPPPPAAPNRSSSPASSRFPQPASRSPSPPGPLPPASPAAPTLEPPSFFSFPPSQLRSVARAYDYQSFRFLFRLCQLRNDCGNFYEYLVPALELPAFLGA